MATETVPLDVSEQLLESIKNLIDEIEDALASVGTDKFNVDIQRQGVQNSFSVSASAAGSTTIYTPSSGKAAQVVGWSFYCDADVVCEMRFSTSGNLIAGLPTKGSHAMNLVGLTPPQGSADETIEIYVSGAANVKGWILIKEV